MELLARLQAPRTDRRRTTTRLPRAAARPAARTRSGPVRTSKAPSRAPL